MFLFTPHSLALLFKVEFSKIYRQNYYQEEPLLESFAMVDDLRRGLMQILSSADGLYAIILTDRDGVPILKVNAEAVPELALRMNFLSTFANATDQASKLGMGKNNAIISMYQNFQVIQLNKMPIVITLIARENANTGYLLKLEDTLEPLVQALRVDVAAAE